MLVVSPEGGVYYPCLEFGKPAGNILAVPDLHSLRRAGLSKFGDQPDCDTRCHSACALGLSLLIRYPWSVLPESVYFIKAKYNGLKIRPENHHKLLSG